jgi:hypothetical protein
LDREFFLGVGRVSALLACFLLYIQFGNGILRWGLLLVTLCQLPLLWYIRKIVPVIQKHNVPPQAEELARDTSIL